MALRSIKELLAHAAEGEYTIGAFNVCNMDTLGAVLAAARQERSPVILQMSMGARRFVPSIPAFVALMKWMAEEAPVPVALNHDHCPTPQAAAEAIGWGFSGAMFDGSQLPYAENARQTRRLAAWAHERGACIEAELGRLPGFEDEVFAEHADFTDPALAARFVEETGCDCLAVSVGTSHGGVKADGPLPLDFGVLSAIHSALPGYPLVLHGAASLPEELLRSVNELGGKVPPVRNCSEEDIARTGRLGVCKANMDVDNFLCFTREVRRVLQDAPEQYDPRRYLGPAREAFAEEVRHKMQCVCGSAGKSWL